MLKAQTYVEWLLNLRVEGVHRLLQTDQQGDLAQNAPVCVAIKLIRDVVRLLVSRNELGKVYLLLVMNCGQKCQ